jgi:hypothetical protein
MGRYMPCSELIRSYRDSTSRKTQNKCRVGRNGIKFTRSVRPSEVFNQLVHGNLWCILFYFILQSNEKEKFCAVLFYKQVMK